MISAAAFTAAAAMSFYKTCTAYDTIMHKICLKTDTQQASSRTPSQNRVNKNLAIANRSRVSCTHNMSMPSITRGLKI